MAGRKEVLNKFFIKGLRHLDSAVNQEESQAPIQLSDINLKHPAPAMTLLGQLPNNKAAASAPQ